MGSTFAFVFPSLPEPPRPLMPAPPRKMPAPARRRPASARLVLAGLLFLLLAAGAAAAFLRPDQLFRSGQQALQRHDFARAQRAFEDYLWYRPRSAAAHLLAARAARRRDAL